MGCCGPKVAAVISCVFCILCAIAAFLGYTRENPNQSIVTGLDYLILAFACFMVIFAGDNASLFLPFLVLKPVVLINLLSNCIVYVTLLLSVSSLEQLVIQQNTKGALYKLRVELIVMLVLTIFFTVLFARFYSIIFRAYVELAEKSAPDNANSKGYGDVAAGPTCCCGPFRARIETAIPVVALIGFLSLLSEASDAFFYNRICTKSCFGFVTSGTVCLAAAIASLVVIFAQRDRNPSLFLPYLIIMPIILIFRLLAIALLLTAIVVGLGLSDPEFYAGLHLTIGFLSKISIFPALHIWFYSLIFRAYKKTKQQMFSHFIANSSSRAEESRVGP